MSRIIHIFVTSGIEPTVPDMLGKESTTELYGFILCLYLRVF